MWDTGEDNTTFMMPFYITGTNETSMDYVCESVYLFLYTVRSLDTRSYFTCRVRTLFSVGPWGFWEVIATSEVTLRVSEGQPRAEVKGHVRGGA